MQKAFPIKPGEKQHVVTAVERKAGGLAFEISVSDKTIISTFYGRGGKDFGKTESILLASLDYERDIVPTLANFIPFALGMGEIVWRSDAPLQ